MKIGLNVRQNSIKISKNNEPPKWSNLIKRWYQLDGESFAIAQSSFLYKEFIGNPTLLIFLSGEGCSNTDCLFAASESLSPSYFVQTVPNVRSLSLSFITGWEGPMICLSKPRIGIISTIAQFSKIIKDDEEILIVSSVKINDEYNCDFYQLTTQIKNSDWIVYNDKLANKCLNDFDFRKKVSKDNNTEPFYILDEKNLAIRRNNE